MKTNEIYNIYAQMLRDLHGKLVMTHLGIFFYFQYIYRTGNFVL